MGWHLWACSLERHEQSTWLVFLRYPHAPLKCVYRNIVFHEYICLIVSTSASYVPNNAVPNLATLAPLSLLLQTIMKIIKYSSDALLSGPLCGFLQTEDRTLEVTEAFPTYADDLSDHQTQMLRALRDVSILHHFSSARLAVTPTRLVFMSSFLLMLHSPG